MTEKHICNGCTACCEEFILDEETLQQTNQTHPQLLTLISKPKKLPGCVTVSCNQRTADVGCNIHPDAIKKETRPSFCKKPNPKTCKLGTPVR